ncbi:unnamed protein product [Mucor fragilis]
MLHPYIIYQSDLASALLLFLPYFFKMNRELQRYISNELETIIHAIGKAGGPHQIRDLLNNAFQETYPECVCSIKKRQSSTTTTTTAAAAAAAASDEITDRITNHLKVIEDLVDQIKK